MINKIKQLLCRHRFDGNSCETFISSDNERIAIIETCVKCRRQFGFSTNIENLGGDVVKNSKMMN